MMSKVCLHDDFAQIHELIHRREWFFSFQIMTILLFFLRISYMMCFDRNLPQNPFLTLFLPLYTLILSNSSALFLKPTKSTSHCLCVHNFSKGS